MGLPEEALTALKAGEESDRYFEVWEENWSSLKAFLAVQTQWRAIPMADGKVYFQGLDYAGVTAGLTGAGIEATPALWADLRMMESAGRNRLNGVMEGEI